MLQPAQFTDEQAADTGDSFLRMTLNVAVVQKELAQRLLERLPEIAEQEDAARAMLSQFRW